MLFVIGSWKIVSDSYLDKEENEKIIDFIIKNLGCIKEKDFEPLILET